MDLVDFGRADVVTQHKQQQLNLVWKVAALLPLSGFAQLKIVDRPAQLPRVPATPKTKLFH